MDIEDEAKQQFPVLHVACPYCGTTMPGEVHKTAEAFSYGGEIQGGKDPWFGLELWFLTSFQGKPVLSLIHIFPLPGQRDQKPFGRSLFPGYVRL